MRAFAPFVLVAATYDDGAYWGISDLAGPHVLMANRIYELPFLRERSGWASRALGHRSQRLELRVEAFNALNHPNWAGASSNPTSGSFGIVTDKTGERVIQLATKYSF